MLTNVHSSKSTDLYNKLSNVKLVETNGKLDFYLYIKLQATVINNLFCYMQVSWCFVRLIL